MRWFGRAAGVALLGVWVLLLGAGFHVLRGSVRIDADGGPGAGAGAPQELSLLSFLCCAATTAGPFGMLAALLQRNCPRCGRPMTMSSGPLLPATPYSCGRGERIYHCYGCGYHTVDVYQIPMPQHHSYAPPPPMFQPAPQYKAPAYPAPAHPVPHYAPPPPMAKPAPSFGGGAHAIHPTGGFGGGGAHAIPKAGGFGGGKSCGGGAGRKW